MLYLKGIRLPLIQICSITYANRKNLNMFECIRIKIERFKIDH